MFQGEKVLIAMSLVLLKLSASECVTVIMIHVLTTGIPFHLCVCVWGGEYICKFGTDLE